MKNILLEKSHSKVMRTLRGLEPNINSVAFISPENPCGNDVGVLENKKRTDEMAEYLMKAKFSFRKIIGKYGGLEHSFLINNITKEDAMEIGKIFEQHSIIFGEKTKDGMVFDMIITYNCFDGEEIGDVIGSRKVFIQFGKDEADFYSKIKGRKFQIPFFDEKYDAGEWFGGKIINPNLDESNSKKFKTYLAESLNRNKTQKHRWIMRGLLSNLLGK